MSEAITRTVSDLRMLAAGAAASAAHGRPRRIRRAGQWARMRSVYAEAARVMTGQDRERAEALALAAAHRSLAWSALAAGDAHDAAHHRRQSHKARAMFVTLTAAVWKR